MIYQRDRGQDISHKLRQPFSFPSVDQKSHVGEGSRCPVIIAAILYDISYPLQLTDAVLA